MASTPPADPFAALLALEGVPSAYAAARDGIDVLLRDRGLRRTTPEDTIEAMLRGAHASAALDGSTASLEDLRRATGDETALASLRISTELLALVPQLTRSPLQVFARLHTLAARGTVPDDELGRPRLDPQVSPRLDLLCRLVTGGSRVPAPILAAVAHGELLAVAPFGSADGVVARAVSRLVTIASGLDPHGLGVPEVYWMRRSADYRAAAAGFAAGTEQGLTDWLVLSCRALQEGAREAIAIADLKK